MATKLASQILVSPPFREAALPGIGRLVLKVLLIALVAMLVVATRYLVFEYAHGGEPVVLGLRQFVSP